MSDFYKTDMTAYGRYPSCKECCKARAAKYRRDNPAYHRAYEAIYSKTERGIAARKAAVKRYRKTAKFRANNARYARVLYARYPERFLARGALNVAVSEGRIKRPARCSQCHRRRKVQGHHHNGYGLKHRLDVVWLCQECHWHEHWKRE